MSWVNFDRRVLALGEVVVVAVGVVLLTVSLSRFVVAVVAREDSLSLEPSFFRKIAAGLSEHPSSKCEGAGYGHVNEIRHSLI